MAEQFADLSHHNTTVDLAAYARAGHSRVVLKATEGTTFTDPAFARRWAQAGAAGLHRGAYHFARTTTGGAAQADRLLAAVAAAGGLAAGDWLVLDLEDDAGLASARAFTAEFCARMASRGHPAGLIYTRTGYAGPAGLVPGDVPAGWRRLWLADYNTRHADGSMPLLAGWARSQVAARQYTDSATVPGITGPVDASRVIHDWLASAPAEQHQEDDDMVIVTAPGRPWLAYYPTSGAARIIGPGEQGPLGAVHKAAGDTAAGAQLTAADFDLLVRHLDRGVRGAIPGLAVVAGQVNGLTTAVAGLAAGTGVDPAAITAAAKAGTEAALHDAAQAAVDATEPGQ